MNEIENVKTNELEQKIEKLVKKERKTYKKREPKKKMSPKNETKKKKLRIVDTLPDRQPVPTEQPSERLNEMVIDVLTRLSNLMSKKGDYIRSRAYTKALDTVLSITTNITSIDDLKISLILVLLLSKN